VPGIYQVRQEGAKKFAMGSLGPFSYPLFPVFRLQSHKKQLNQKSFLEIRIMNIFLFKYSVIQLFSRTVYFRVIGKNSASKKNSALFFLQVTAYKKNIPIFKAFFVNRLFYLTL
jgi:hypothetical protein